MMIFGSKIKSNLRCLFLFFIVVIAGVTIAEAKVLNVPTDYATIPAAITAGNSGDVIRVHGTVESPYEYVFAGNLSFGIKAMTLESASGIPETVVLRGNNTSNSTIWLQSTDAVGSVIRGITIIGNRDGKGRGGAINIEVSARIENCIIKDSSAEEGGGVYISNESLPSFKNCRFINNYAGKQGGAVFVTGDAFPNFTNCLFVGNSVKDNFWVSTDRGDVMYLDSTPTKLMNCTLTDNESSHGVIYQAGSNLPLIITNSIINTKSDSHRAVVGNAWGPAQRNANIASSFIRGSYRSEDDAISNVFEPKAMVLIDGTRVNYPNEYVRTSEFKLDFTADYHLNMTSSAIGIGIVGNGSDIDGEPRPYYLGHGTDIGSDQFNFGYLVTNNLEKNSYWYDVSLEKGMSMTIASGHTTGQYFQTGKVRFYRIVPAESGMIRISSTSSTVDLKGVLTDDWTGYNILDADDNSGAGDNFSVMHINAKKGKSYYLGVINKTEGSGTFDLVADLVTDDRGNGIDTADTSLGIFDQTYFEPGYADKTASGALEHEDDVDCFRVDVSGPGTFMITSGPGTTPEMFDVILQNIDGQVISESKAAGEILIMYDNIDAESCFLIVRRNKQFNWLAGMNYDLDIRYYPLDEIDPVTITLAGGTGHADANITIPGDRDIFEFTVSDYGTLKVYTTGCSVNEKAKVYIHNFLDEQLSVNGKTVSGTGNYIIEEALVTSGNSTVTTAVPLTVSPGKYYLKVSALGGHRTPFSYGLTVEFATAATDDHGNYKETATIMRKWADVLTDAPLLYFKKEYGKINSAGDIDFYRVDLPYKGVLKIMSDSAVTTGAVKVVLKNRNGEILQSSDDVRTANPHYTQPLSKFPEWEGGLVYTVNEIIKYDVDGKFYRCIQGTAGQNPSDSAYWAEAAVPPENIDGILAKSLASGSYYIEVTGAAGTEYLLSVDFDDFGDDVSTASLFKPNYAFNAFEGHFETVKSPAFRWSYDADAWKLIVEKEGKYTIYTTGNSDTYGVLKDVNGKEREDLEYVDIGPGVNFKFTITLEPGEYFIVTCMQDTDTTGDYKLHIDQVDDYGNTYNDSNTGTITVGSSIQGVIGSPGDVDYFKFIPGSSGRVRFTVDSTIEIVMNLTVVTNQLGSPVEERLIHSSSGLLEFDVTAGETYYLNVRAEFIANTGTYTVSCEMVPGASVDNDGEGGTSGGDNYETARTLYFDGGTASYTDGGIDRRNDHDFYKFSVTGPGVLRVYTTGTTDTYGYLFLEHGGMYNLVACNDDSDFDKTNGYNFGIEHYVDSGPRNFHVKVRGYAPHETGDYQLHVVFTPGGTDDHGDECRNATHVNRNAAGTVWENGIITFEDSEIGISGDRDCFRIVAGPEGADPGSISVYTTDGSLPIDSFGYLKDEICGTIALNDNGKNAGDGDNFRILYAPSGNDNSGPRTYYVMVKSYNDSQTGTYNLHIKTNGASVEPVSKTTMAMTPEGSKYFGFVIQDMDSYLTAKITGLDGYDVGQLRFTLMNGSGQIVDGYENLPVTSPVKAQVLKRGQHYIRITNTGSSEGDFSLDLNCSSIGYANFGNGAGVFEETASTMKLTCDGTGFDGSSDNGFFVFTKATGSIEFTAKITFESAVANTQAGIGIRQGTGADAVHVASMLMRNSNNNAWHKVTRYRASKGSNTSNVSNLTNAANDYYVRLHYDRRNEKFITGYSADGITWKNTDSFKVDVSESFYVGFLSASGTDGAERTVTFSNITFVESPWNEE